MSRARREDRRRCWEAQVEDWKTGLLHDGWPAVVKGKVLVGVAGGEFGVLASSKPSSQDRPFGVKTNTIRSPASPRQRTIGRRLHLEDGRRLPPDDGNYDPTPTRLWALETLRPGSAISEGDNL